MKTKYISNTKPTDQEIINNLNMLADFLDSDKIPPPRFNMGVFAVHIQEAEDMSLQEVEYRLQEDNYTQITPQLTTDDLFRNSCGTVCCMVGHGPMAGIKPDKGDNDWNRYSYKFTGNGDNYSIIFAWLFSYQWQYIDNTPKGGAARIRDYINHGIPVNYVDQMAGKEPLSYLD